jgi:Domain of Unknown Function (DUF928)
MIKNLTNLGLIFGLIVLISNFKYPHFLNLTAIAATISAKFNLKLPPPPNRGIAGNRHGAASRIIGKDPISENGAELPTITAFVPEYQNVADSGQTGVWGLTTNEHPTFWFYISEIKSQLYRLDFSIYDRESRSDRPIYQTSMENPQQAGVINFALPNSSQPLSTNKLYQWELKFTLKSTNKPRIVVKGWIQRASLDTLLRDRLRRANPAQQAVLYAERGLWYDTFTILANLHYAKPQDTELDRNWQILLDAIQLGDLADRSLVMNHKLEQVPRSQDRGF